MSEWLKEHAWKAQLSEVRLLPRRTPNPDGCTPPQPKFREGPRLLVVALLPCTAGTRRCDLEDESLVEAFERAEISEYQFSHVEHVRVAWWYLSHHPFVEARDRFSEALRRFAASKGKAERYHETITVAYLLVIAHRIQQTPALIWSVFADAHADLLSHTPPILARYYSDETLISERATREFVLPDRAALPVSSDGGPPGACGTAVVPC
jgi:hypothetical protein